MIFNQLRKKLSAEIFYDLITICILTKLEILLILSKNKKKIMTKTTSLYFSNDLSEFHIKKRILN